MTEPQKQEYSLQEQTWFLLNSMLPIQKAKREWVSKFAFDAFFRVLPEEKQKTYLETLKLVQTNNTRFKEIWTQNLMDLLNGDFNPERQHLAKAFQANYAVLLGYDAFDAQHDLNIEQRIYRNRHEENAFLAYVGGVRLLNNSGPAAKRHEQAIEDLGKLEFNS